MNLQRKSLQLGAAMVVCAIVLRLISTGAPAALVRTLSDPQALAVMLYLETGRIVRPAPQTPENQPVIPSETTAPTAAPIMETAPTTATAPGEIVEESTVLPVFSPQDASLVEINSVCGYATDLSGWLSQPLSWDLTADGPAVLIVHTHGSESYKNTENYQESSPYRTKDNGYNMVSVGEALAKLLEENGIGVVHDKSLHDVASFNNAYGSARKSIKQYLSDYPTIRMVLDLHRDAVGDGTGDQPGFSLQIGDKKAAKLMFVIGTDANGLAHPDWQKNMALGVKLQALLEKQYPGVCRPISFRKQRFNQDLSAGGLIVEVGAAGNTRQQALEAVQLLGNAIVALSKGAATAVS